MEARLVCWAGIYIAFFLNSIPCVFSQPDSCQTWSNVCAGNCLKIEERSRANFNCQECKIQACQAIKGPGQCGDFATTPCGEKIQVFNCALPSIVEKIFEICEDDDDDSGDVNQREPSPDPRTVTQANTSDDSDNTTVIVIAVCVSVVVVLLAVLVTGVYCWRVRRKSRAEKRSERVGLGDNAFTNESYRRGHEIGRDRPESTYNTINDSQPDHEYHTLESATKSALDSQNSEKENEYNVTNEYRVLEPNGQGKMNKAKYDEIKTTNEYNKIKFNKSVVRSNDPSYSHLNSTDKDSDYNSTSDKPSTTTSAYQYGVPIKIVGIDKLQAEHVAYVTKAEHDKTALNHSKENSNESGVSNDNYAVASKINKESKPKAVVTPMQKDGGLLLPTRAVGTDGTKQADSDSESEYESDIGNVTRAQNDDYEITESKIGKDNSKSQQSVVHIAERPKNVTDDYEIAAIQNDNNYDNKPMNVNVTNVAGSEIDKKTFRIVEQKTDKEVNGNDGYELTEL